MLRLMDRGCVVPSQLKGALWERRGCCAAASLVLLHIAVCVGKMMFVLQQGKSISHNSIHSQHSLPLSCFSSFLAAGWIKSPLVTMASREEVTLSEEEVRSRYGHLEKMTDLVAVWEVALSDGIHKIEFEHGTTSGKRVVYVDGKEEIRKEWMFKLVGKETFTVGASKTRATINIDAVSGFAYEYTLEINGKSLKKYMENRSKTTNTWVLSLGGTDYRVVLEKDTMDVWCNGKKMETAGEFVEDGTETHFSVGDHSCYIKAVSSGKRKEGIIHTLIVDDREIPEAVE